MSKSNKECPICHSFMWDNREDKKNPKAPDWKCSNKECKKQFNYKTQQWEDSQYSTSIWEKKEQTGSSYGSGTSPEAQNGTSNASSGTGWENIATELKNIKQRLSALEVQTGMSLPEGCETTGDKIFSDL